MMTATPMPGFLFAAYDWTRAAGQLEELHDLTGEALATYVRESAANWRDHGSPGAPVTADDLTMLHDWLVAIGSKTPGITAAGEEET
jgi:hypothetical protein